MTKRNNTPLATKADIKRLEDAIKAINPSGGSQKVDPDASDPAGTVQPNHSTPEQENQATPANTPASAALTRRAIPAPTNAQNTTTHKDGLPILIAIVIGLGLIALMLWVISPAVDSVWGKIAVIGILLTGTGAGLLFLKRTSFKAFLTGVGIGLLILGLIFSSTINTKPAAQASVPIAAAASQAQVAASAPIAAAASQAEAQASASAAASPSASTVSGKILIDGKEVPLLDQGDRLYWSAGWQITGHAAPYSQEEMAKIESKWFDIKVVSSSPISFFGYSAKIGDKNYTPGVLVKVPSDLQFKGLNFEIVIWSNNQLMQDEISNRISTEIQNGNLSIKSPLAFTYCDDSFVQYVPKELLDQRKVKSISIVG